MSELNKKMMETSDLNKERLEKLKDLFPDLFTMEGKLNPDELKKIIDPELVKETERFEFKWFGKSDAKRTAFTPSKATLVYDEDRSVNPAFADGNMIIEGENLETLKCLLSAYRERIKCIYIDPPYNTGKDFVYSDSWNENKETYWEHVGVSSRGIKIDTNSESAGRYHSNWLNMLYPRLLISRQLLTEDGIIFISIDDTEVHHLRKICDAVFGENNFIANIIWQGGRKNDSKRFSIVHDYFLVYVKNELLLKEQNIKWRERKDGLQEVYDKVTELKETQLNNFEAASQELQQWFTDLPNGSSAKDHSHYRGIDSGGAYYGDNISSPNFRENLIYDYKGYKPPNNGWRYNLKSMSKLDEEGLLIFPEDKTKRIQYKRYLHLTETWAPSTWFYKDRRAASKKLVQLLGGDFFDFPKDDDVLARFINTFTNENDFILDFFAGSGTTAHSVMKLNKKDGGNRKFILVQLPEATDEKSEAYKAGYKKISDITIERNKRVIENIEKEQTEKDPSLFDEDNKPVKTGFKVYKLSKSNFPRVDFAPDSEKSEEENIKSLNEYIDEKEAMFLSMIDETHVFDEVLLKNGFMLNYSKIQENTFSRNSVYRIKDDFKECLICMDISIAKETLKDLESCKDILFICLERSLDTTMKWNLKHLLGDKLVAF